MRALTPHGNYSLQLFEPIVDVVPMGNQAKEIIRRKPLNADFEKQGLLDHEVDAVFTHFNFTGVPEGVNPITRVAVFDSEAFVQQYPEDEQAELQKMVDDRLLQLSKHFPTQFIIVEPPLAPIPWPSYDDDPMDKILEYQAALRIPPQTIRLYEIENKGRVTLIDRMTELEEQQALEAGELVGA